MLSFFCVSGILPFSYSGRLSDKHKVPTPPADSDIPAADQKPFLLRADALRGSVRFYFFSVQVRIVSAHNPHSIRSAAPPVTNGVAIEVPERAV